MRPAFFTLALLAVSVAACADNEPPPPENLVFVGYDGWNDSTVRVQLSIDVAPDRVTLTQDGQPTYTATLTAEAHAQLDIAENQVERTWEPAEPCPTCRLYPETFYFHSDQGPVTASYGFVEDRTNVDQLRTVIDALVFDLTACRGGNLIEQCVAQP